ncbi:unnamed protein product [Caenorhabditis angaria]|uniref:Uncharacterized protein n=1 Tax=Caenorhabditis angaria TaxID=860376 RepID=A0A9P1IDC5_9PELO|nr:unnamed protein product [Caenorhabditis angaria]
MIQDVSYLKLKINMFWDILRYFEISCTPYYKVSYCTSILRGMLIASSGLMIIQSSMSFDRIFDLFFQRYYGRFRALMAIIFSGFAVIISYFVFEFLTIGDPLEGEVLNCAYFSPKSAGNFQFYINLQLYISIFHIVLDLFILEVVIRRKTKSLFSFNVMKRFHAKESLKSTQYMVALSTIQFTAQVLSSISTIFLLTVSAYLNSLSNAIAVSLLYSMPYFCVAHPIFIIWMLRKTRIERWKSIRILQRQKETQDDHMKRIRKAWA